MLLKFHQFESGATAVEYAIMLALIVAICFAAILMVGFEASSFWSSNAEKAGDILNSHRTTTN